MFRFLLRPSNSINRITFLEFAILQDFQRNTPVDQNNSVKHSCKSFIDEVLKTDLSKLMYHVNIYSLGKISQNNFSASTAFDVFYDHRSSMFHQHVQLYKLSKKIGIY